MTVLYKGHRSNTSFNISIVYIKIELKMCLFLYPYMIIHTTEFISKSRKKIKSSHYNVALTPTWWYEQVTHSIKVGGNTSAKKIRTRLCIICA